jgi:hypothetical protein
LPNAGVISRIDTVGGIGPDFTSTVTGHISQSEGSFDSATGITSSGAYTLQLNTDFFQTSACSGSPGGMGGTCQGWEQFVYTTTGQPSFSTGSLKFDPAARRARCPDPRPVTARMFFGRLVPVHIAGWFRLLRRQCRL